MEEKESLTHWSYWKKETTRLKEKELEEEEKDDIHFSNDFFFKTQRLASCFEDGDIPYLSWNNLTKNSPKTLLLRSARTRVSEYPEDNQENFTAASEFMENLFHYYGKVGVQ